MRGIWLLAVNDLRLTLRDRPAFIWMLLMPVAMMWFFGNMGGGGGGAPSTSLTVVSHDDGWLAAAFVEELGHDRLVVNALSPAEAATAEEKVRSLIIPAGFTAGVLAGEQQVLRLEKEPGSNQQFGFAAQVYITRAIVRTLSRTIEIAREANVDDELALERFRELGERPPLVSLAVETAGVGRPVPSGRAQSVPGILTMTVLMMTLIYGAVFLALERQQGMLRRQGTVPLGARQIFAGKVLGRLLIAALQIVMLVVAGRFLFGVSWGDSPLGLGLMIVSYAIAVAGLATLLGAIVNNAAQASVVGWIGSMVLAAVGGCWWPAELMPEWMQTAAHAFPTTWAMDGFHALISFGHGVDGVILPAVVLLGFGAGAALLGARLLRFEQV